MILVKIQIALFPLGTIDRPDKVLNEINSNLQDAFDGMPQILDLPTIVPDNTPLATGKSEDNTKQLNISRGRIDLVIKPANNTNYDPIALFSEHKAFLEKYLDVAFCNRQLKRIGIIFTLIELSDTNVKLVFDKYLKQQYTPNSTEATIRINRLTILDDIAINNLTTIKTPILKSDNKLLKTVMIEMDTNNSAHDDDDTAISLAFSHRLLNHASSKMTNQKLKEMI